MKKKELCNLIKNKLLDLERNSKGKNKKTYFRIPKNHKEIMFPYNLEDRPKYILKDLKFFFRDRSEINVKHSESDGIIKVSSKRFLDSDHEYLVNLKGKYKDNTYIIDLKI